MKQDLKGFCDIVLGLFFMMRLLREIDSWKEKHFEEEGLNENGVPYTVILTRVADFYEAYGLDAAILVEFALLNPIGGTPKVSFQAGIVQAVCDCLTVSGMKVGIYEEIAIKHGRNSKKERYRRGEKENARGFCDISSESFCL